MVLKKNRRSILKLFGLTSTSLFISSQTVDCAFFFNRYKDDKVKGIPDDWFKLEPNVHQYGNYILSLKLKNITPRMVIAPHFKTRGKVRNSLPPKKMWKQIGPTLKVIDKLSLDIGVPIKEILSVYRSPEYNKAVRGNKGSYHMCNKAVDISFKNKSSWSVAKSTRKLRSNKFFKGGIGTYKRFVHIDTRGKNVDW